MKKNMGFLDRGLRIMLAVTFSVLYLTDVITGSAGVVVMVFSSVLLATSVVGFCPLYLPFRLKTCRVPK